MRIPKKKVLTLIGGVVGFIAIALLLRIVLNYQIFSKIPELPESNIQSIAVKDQISEALAIAHKRPSAENIGMLGMIYHSSALYEMASQCYDLAIAREQSEWIWNYYLGFLNMEMGNSDAVIENFNRVLELNPEVHHASYYLGEQYKNLNKYELAETLFKRAIVAPDAKTVSFAASRYDYFPLSTYAMFQLARLYMDTDRTELAEKTLQELIQSQRSFGPAYRILGNIYRENGDLEQSERFRVRANDLLVFSPPVDTLVDRLVLLSRSELYLLKKIDEAERSIYPEWAMKLTNHAMNYIPDNKFLLSKAIRISLMLDLDEQAAALANSHIGHYMDNLTEMNNMGLLFFQKRLYPQSMKYLTRALEIDPQDAEMWYCMAICHWSLGDRQKALGILDEMLLENKDKPEVLTELTNILLDLGEFEKANSQLGRLEHLSPANPKVLKMSGLVAQNNGDLQEAIILYESSLRKDPKDLSTLRLLSNLLIQEHRWSAYIKYFRIALEHHPNDPYLLESLGTMLITCPDPDLRNASEGRYYAERAFIHTTSRSMTLVSAGRSLALAHATLGDKQNASRVIQMTLNVARRENVSPSYLKDLEEIARRIQTLE